jgi:hypothetical protein
MTGCLKKGTEANSYMVTDVEGNGPKSIGIVSSTANLAPHVGHKIRGHRHRRPREGCGGGEARTAEGSSLCEANGDQDALGDLPIVFGSAGSVRVSAASAGPWRSSVISPWRTIGFYL